MHTYHPSLIIFSLNLPRFMDLTDGRIAPRSGLAWKKHIDVGAGVIDADCKLRGVCVCFC